MPQFYVPVAVSVMLAVGSKILQSAMAPGNTLAQADIDHSIMANECSTQWSLPICYGKCRVGNNQVYASTRSDSNRNMDLLCVIGEGQLSGIVREDGTVWTDTATLAPTTNPPLIYFDDSIWTDYATAGSVYTTIMFYDGASDQISSAALRSANPADDQLFATAMRHTAYLYLVYYYDREKFNSMPKITVVVAGVEISNPITSVTEWTDNAALCTYDFMTRPSTRGGMGLSSTLFNQQSLSDSIDYCTEKGWTCNMAVHENIYAADNLEKLLACWRGHVTQDENGLLRLGFRDLNNETTVMDLTDDDVVDGSFQATYPDALGRPNAIRIKYYAEERNYQLEDYVFTDATALAAEGDYREITRECLGLSTIDLIQPMAYYYLERARNGREISFVGGRRTIALEPEDLVVFEHRVPGWTDKMLRVVRTSPDLENFTSTITLIEESTEFYDKDYDELIEDLFVTTLPDPNADILNVINVSHAEEVFYYRGRSYTRWKIFFDPPDEEDYPWWDYAEIWVKVGDAGEWVYHTRSEMNYVLDPVEEGQRYTVKIVGVNIFRVKQQFDFAMSVTKVIIGKTDDPSNLSWVTAIANGDTVSIYAEPVTDPDIDGYEIRMGSSFFGGIFIKYSLHPSATIAGVRPGTHTFWMSPVRLSTSGTKIYSSTPVSATCTVFIPAGYTSIDSEIWDYNAIGTHDNTEHTTYNATSHLKCSHTASVLVGAWDSPTWDLLSVQKLKLWADFTTAFVASATTVEGIAGTTLTTEDIGGATKSVSQIVGVINAGNVQMVMSFSTDDIVYSNVPYFEILSAEVNVRYVKLEITVEDPTPDSNLYIGTLTMQAYEGPT